MSWFSRPKKSGQSPRAQRRATVDAMVEWVAQHRGVEVFVEPKTSVTPVTMLLVAYDGEFTRRAIRTPEEAKSFARDHRLPIYDATIVGYPQRMRDYSRRQTILAERKRRLDLGD